MDLPEIPAAAYAAGNEEYYLQNDVFDSGLEAAWPHLYAAALNDFADRMDKALETVGAGEDPAMAYRFVVACARSLADDALVTIA